MPKTLRVVIVGAGPSGLSAALALARHPSTSTAPVHITVLELRNKVQTIGGAVNLTPLALRYLDALGAGPRLRPRGNPVSAIELVAHRTGRVLACLWPDVDALRVLREAIVEALLETAQKDVDPKVLEILYGAKVKAVENYGAGDDGGVRVTYTNSGGGSEDVTIDADLVLGCDGIHSFLRRQVVEPDRPKTYTGKCVAYGFIPVSADEAVRWTRADGKPLVGNTTLIQGGAEALLMAYYEPPGKQKGFYLAVVMPVPDVAAGSAGEGSSREGWAVHGADKQGLHAKISAMFAGGAIPSLHEILDRCDDWFFFPVHMLPDGGVWSKGRVLLLGDAAHAMPPQGESTGVAIEDGVLLAHVLSRRDTRSMPQMLADYETLRRKDISGLYKTSMTRWNSPAPAGWLGRVFMEWMSWIVVSYLNWTSNHFARDVREFPLPQ